MNTTRVSNSLNPVLSVLIQVGASCLQRLSTGDIVPHPQTQKKNKNRKNQYIVSLQYNHDVIQKKGEATVTSLFPFEENSAQFGVKFGENKKQHDE